MSTFDRACDVDHGWDWQAAIREACTGEHEWQARKFIGALLEHKRRYPAFEPSRVAEIFLRSTPKSRGWYCYRPISEFTKGIHKHRSIRSLAASQD